MRMYKVEVDEEVFQFIKDNAEPLVDTFNSTLRRLLPLSERRGRVSTPSGGEGVRPEPAGLLPSIPNRVPQALRQILEVVHLVLSSPYSRSSATNYVARHHKKAPQTIIDKYTRQLSLTATEFDQLLEQPGLGDLRKMLKSKFPGFTQLIDELIVPASN
jgi:hypothetical protein